MRKELPVGVVVGVGIVIGHEIFNKIILSIQYKKYKRISKQEFERKMDLLA